MKKWIAPFVISSLFFTSLSYGAMMKFDLESLKNKTLDIEQFDRNKDHGNDWVFTLPDGSKGIIREVFRNTKKFVEDIKAADGIYNYQLHYNAEGKTTFAIKSFYNMDIGKVYYFDRQKDMVRVEDLDEDFGMSVDELIIKLKKEHDIDLLDPEKVMSIERNSNYRLTPSSSEKRPVYLLDYMPTGETDELYRYCIDGNTGDVLQKERIHIYY